MKIKVAPTWKPRCPVCNAILEGVPWPLPKKGVGRCPAAGNYEFEAESDDTKITKDKDGNITKAAKWKLDGDMTPHK